MTTAHRNGSIYDTEGRVWRTTLERIGDLRNELHAMRQEAEGRRLAQLDRIHRVEVANARPDRSGVVSFGTFAVVAGVWAALLGMSEPSAATPLAVLAPATWVESESLADDVTFWPAYEIAPVPMLDVKLAVDETPEPVVAPKPASKKRRQRVRRAKSRPVPVVASASLQASEPARGRPAHDPLAGIMDCGDDPICGL